MLLCLPLRRLLLMAYPAFQIIKESKKTLARTGVLHTAHGDIETPAFVPVATQAAFKGASFRDAKEAGTQIVMVNTYHLWVRGAASAVARLGGLHRFMQWDKPVMTDSGGFQVFSLGAGYGQEISKLMHTKPIEIKPHTRTKGLAHIDDAGIDFRSHLNGKSMRLTPAISIGVQEKLGADIMFALDECTSPTDSYEYTKESLMRTHAWAKESLATKKRRDQLLFGIVQGGRWKDLREESARVIGSMEFDGFGIGGGFGKDDVVRLLKWSIPLLPENKPRHYLGIGEIDDILASVASGIDIFDCVIPTRLARHGVLITQQKRIIIRQSSYKSDKNPIEKNCPCFTCNNFSKAYLHHLFRAKETLGGQLATIHNLYFYNRLMENIRNDIKEGRM